MPEPIDVAEENFQLLVGLLRLPGPPGHQGRRMSVVLARSQGDQMAEIADDLGISRSGAYAHLRLWRRRKPEAIGGGPSAPGPEKTAGVGEKNNGRV